MEFWICTIAKCEELYIREWVEWHKKIGFTHIIIGDNNRKDYPYKLYDYIKEYVDSGFVEIFEESEVKQIQPTFYNKCYKKYIGKFDYITFIDIDEFIELPKHKTIDKFLNDDRIKQYDAVVLNCLVYNDNDLLYYENKPVKERFTKYIDEKKNTTKYILKYNQNINSIYTSHYPQFEYKEKNYKINICDALGNKLDIKTEFAFQIITSISSNNEYVNNTHISHYITKSTEEYIKYKVLRGRALYSNLLHNIKYDKFFYYKYNKKTEDKEKLFDKYKEQINKYFESVKQIKKGVS